MIQMLIQVLQEYLEKHGTNCGTTLLGAYLDWIYKYLIIRRVKPKSKNSLLRLMAILTTLENQSVSELVLASPLINELITRCSLGGPAIQTSALHCMTNILLRLSESELKKWDKSADTLHALIKSLYMS